MTSLLVADSLQSLDMLHLCNYLPDSIFMCQCTDLIPAYHSFMRHESHAFHIYMSLKKQHRYSAHNVKTAFTFRRHCKFLYNNRVKSLSMNILSIVAPAGIIGNTFSPSPTHASSRKAPSVFIIFSMASSSSSREVTLAEGMPYACVIFWKSGFSRYVNEYLLS